MTARFLRSMSFTGKKFDVTYRSVETLEALIDPNPSSPFANLVLITELEIVKGRWDFTDLNLNKLLPQVKPVGIKDFLEKWWGTGNAA